VKLAILSSAGDSAGMNMAIGSLFEFAQQEHIDCAGVKQGLQGLIEFSPEKNLPALSAMWQAFYLSFEDLQELRLSS